MSASSRPDRRFLFTAFASSLLAVLLVAALGRILTPLLPRPFQLVDALSELSVVWFAFLWLLLMRDVESRRDRIVLFTGIILVGIGAAADVLDEFGIGAVTTPVENFAFVGGVVLVVRGLQDWIRVNRQEHQDVQERNAFLAYRDSLTGLRNRRSFGEALEILATQAERHPDNGVIALLYLDLDRFKTINDSLGHSFGDRVLVQVASRLEQAVRSSDLCFRLGGDEFVVLAPNLHTEADAHRIAQKISASLDHGILLGNRMVQASTSIGIALLPRDGTDQEELLRKADLAMYAAKRAGEPVRFFEAELSEIAVRRAELEADLRRAIAAAEITVAYQPIVDRVGRPLGYEALARWMHPVHGAIDPDAFIPVAEEAGLISDLGLHVLKHACRDLAARLHSVSADLFVSVNVSALQLRNESFAADVLRTLQTAGLDPHFLTLELTESGLMDNSGPASGHLETLQAEGVRIAIDDFGAGHSSLSQLRRLPAGIVKFDQTLVADESLAGRQAGGQGFLPGLVTLITRLGRSAVVEGIETEDQLADFPASSDLQFQGFLFGRPQPVEAVERQLQQILDGEPLPSPV